MAFNVVACGIANSALHGEWRIQRGTESLSLLTGFGVNAVDQPHCQRRPRRDRDFLGGGGGGGVAVRRRPPQVAVS